MTAEQPACGPPDVATTERTMDERISDAEAILNRTIGFISNSDSKTSIALSIIGVMLTMIFTLAGDDIMSMFSEVYHYLDATGVLFVLLFLASLALSLYGTYQLVMVLVPRLDPRDFETENYEKDSRIYFGKISDNRNYEEYRSKMERYGPEDHLDDLWSQIYVNSKICIRKFRCFKRGWCATVPGMLALLAVIMIFRFLILG